MPEKNKPANSKKNPTHTAENKAKAIPLKSDIALKEEAVLKFWNDNKIFQKSLEKPSAKGEFVFYDGPPFATGLPHHGHMLPGTIKDALPRFKTMQGYHVPRKWGWDCHGLPVENLIEKELGLKGKKDIEELGIEKFNAAARASVLRYDADWKRIIPRAGRWVDMDHAYLTMNPSYSESIWWSFKALYDKNLIYQGFKVMPFCPHDGTTLSNFEVAQGYKDITDVSAYVKFELVDEPNTFVIAWTTTPWTLPGNVALAVKSDIEYLKAKVTSGKFKDQTFVFAKESFEKIAPFIEANEGQVSPAGVFIKGSELVGKKYKPVFDYYINADLKNKENLYKIVGADFVTTTDGTGVVHIAPAFGEDDYNLSLTEKLPFIQHVGTDGKFKKEVTDFVGLSVKPKDSKEEPKAHQSGDVAIIKYLSAHNTLFAKEAINHSYPHCWRCDTPLLNYATSSWFVEVTKFKDKLVSENSKVKWVPHEIGEGRFGKWLENARDWAISRSRYWGAPLPVWVCKECDKKEVIGSIDDLKKHTRRNTYLVMRHGEALNNAKNIVSCGPDAPHPLTEKGKQQVQDAIAELKRQHIDLIISSDVVRTKETTEILQYGLGLDAKKVEYDERLREYGFGDFNMKTRDEWHAYWKTRDWSDVSTKVPGGESPYDAHDRVARFIRETDAKYSGKTILIVSHEDPLRYLISYASGENIADVSRDEWQVYQLRNAEVRPLSYALLPRNDKGELDVHRPYIDEITFPCSCGGTMHRVPEVFDTWYESGSMPYAQLHYPFENKEKIDGKTFFPADLIAEGQDQTRGWFYSLLVLSTSLFEQSPYKNVVVNGIILAEDGQKMSKRLKNYPELEAVFDKYGADALRYFLLASPAVKAEDVSFSEKGLDEVLKKLTMRLQNVYTFYATYAHESDENKDVYDPYASKNILDVWILARLGDLTAAVTKGLEAYELDRATRPFMNFVDDLSTWYLRRSRDRFKGDNEEDKQYALATTKYIFTEFSKLLAPFMPFLAEDLYQKVKGDAKAISRNATDRKESVHLESWPVIDQNNEKEAAAILESMQKVRDVVSLALEARAKANIKVRQPLQSLMVRDALFAKQPEFSDILKDEVNVKEIRVDEKLADKIALDTNISKELKLEGQARDFIRAVQEFRKHAGLSPHDVVALGIQTSAEGRELIEAFKADISKTAQLSQIIFSEKMESIEREEVKIDEMVFFVAIVK